MFEKSEATEPSQERKITTAVGKAKRPEGMEDKRSRMFEKSEATEPSQERKITTAVGKAKRPEDMQRISEMKKICAILAMMVMMAIMSAGCGTQKEVPSEVQSSPVQPSPVQSSSAQTETAESSEEEKDAVQLSNTGTTGENIGEGEVTAETEATVESGAAAETGRSSKSITEEKKEENNAADEETGEVEKTMRLLIGKTEVPVAWEKNASVKALQELCPLTIQMSRYGGFEQVGSIGQNIVREDEQTVTDSGDIVLYSGNQIVIFYGSNSWAYTRLGHIDLSEQEMRDLLGGGDVSITLE